MACLETDWFFSDVYFPSIVPEIEKVRWQSVLQFLLDVLVGGRVQGGSKE